MKKLLFIIAAVLLFSCEKEPYQEPIDPNKGNVTLWTTENSGWMLVIDDAEAIPIVQPYPINTTDKIPVCGDERFTNVSLMKGRHKYRLSYLTLQPYNYIIGQTYYFDVTAGGCTVVRCTQ